MPLTDVPTLEASTEIDAAPGRVWELVGDLRNMRRWSPQNMVTFVRGEAAVGTKLINLNRRKLLVWPTQAMIVRYQPGREIAFRIKENWTIWSYTLEPVDGGAGTRLTERREAPKGISDLSVKLTRSVLGGVEEFHEELRRGMALTLARIKAEAERGGAG